MKDRKLLAFDEAAGGEPEVHANLESLASGECNDMVVDGKGRAYVGNFGFDMFNMSWCVHLPSFFFLTHSLSLS